jgi:hypothetical protein
VPGVPGNGIGGGWAPPATRNQLILSLNFQGPSTTTEYYQLPDCKSISAIIFLSMRVAKPLFSVKARCRCE